ncbi:hypothetical protein [Gardnerella vaginalis]|uniref:Uncharacterized protein n=1 Tax=Gardnerella vaginalis TaxID=2702 RepID=A0A133NPD6_GARVA|nr:hypothetical protein [Gardnerella vaginalis]KXA18127.1 hypothetical protein HMPREF3216_00916 [Gardnerella vaginalis]
MRRHPALASTQNSRASKEARHLDEPLATKTTLADSSAQHPRCNGKSLKYPFNVIGI